MKRFTEPGSGLVMEFGKWYVLSDSGSYFDDQGFATIEAAQQWWDDEGRAAFEWPGDLPGPISVPRFLGGGDGWDESYSPQLMKADDLYEFWKADPGFNRSLREQD